MKVGVMELGLYYKQKLLLSLDTGISGTVIRGWSW